MFVFIETKLSTRLADEHLPDDELWRLQTYLNYNAEAGDIIRGSGGVRKLRWAATGRGKRGGLSIIYCLRSKQGEIWLLTLYAKNVAESIAGRVLKKIKGGNRWLVESETLGVRFSTVFARSSAVSTAA